MNIMTTELKIKNFIDENHHIKNLAYALLAVYLVLITLDYSGDYLINNIFTDIQNLIRKAIPLLFIILSIFSIINIKKLKLLSNSGLVILSILLVVFLYGTIIGLKENYWINVLNDARCIIPLLFIPVLLSFTESKLRNLKLIIIYTILVLLLSKLLLSQLNHVIIYGYLSWKVLLKNSVYLIIPMTYLYLLNINKENPINKWHVILIFLLSWGIFEGSSRLFILNIILITAILFFKANSLKKYFVILIAILFAYVGYSYKNDSLIYKILLPSKSTRLIEPAPAPNLLQGDYFDRSLNHRQVQAKSILSRLEMKPIVGYGLGYFNENYSDYYLLKYPYLLELDMPNFISKIGLFFGVIYTLTWVFFLFKGLKYVYQSNSKAIDSTFLICIFVIYLNSFFQTAHSTIFFWTIFSFSFVILFKKKENLNFNA